MKKLWVFGDSFSSIFGIEDDINLEYIKKYPNYDSSIPPAAWYDHLSKKLNCTLERFSFPGGSNDLIISTILENLQYISKDDIIIVGWTRPTRFSIPVRSTNNGFFVSIANRGASELVDSTYHLNGSLNSYFDDIYLPNMDYYVSTKINTIIHFSNYLKNNFNFKSWNWWDIPHQSIRDEFPNQHDNHPSLKGHYQIFEEIDRMEYGTTSKWDLYHIDYTKNLD